MNVNKKVLQTTNQNLITLKDIRTRKRFWENPWIFEDRIDERGGTINKGKKKENLDYRDLVIYTGWKWWQKDYKFLPTPNKFVEIKKDFLENTWGTLDKQEYFILRNKNNQLTIIFQNKKQLDFIRPDTVIFFGRNTADKEGKARQERASRKGIEYPNLYWISSWDYINNKNLFCQLTCEKDPIWANYGDMMNSKGTANITSSQINNDHLNKEGKIIASANEHWPNDEDWKDADGDENTGDNNCSACDNCYDFCGDLRAKRACSVGYSTQGKVAQWQPDFKLLYTVFPKDLFNTGIRQVSVQSITDDGNPPKLVCSVPSNIELKEWHPGLKFDSIMSDVKIPSLLFIVDKQHRGKDGSGVPTADPRREPRDKAKYIWEELPKCYHEQPHLLNHSSAQFYFQKKLLFTANLKHLFVKRKSPGFHLGYRILIRSSIAGILYCFESRDIFYKWELKVRGSISDTNFLNQLIGSVVGGFMKKAGGKLLKMGKSIPFMGGLFEAAGDAVEGKKDEKGGSPSMADILTGKMYSQLVGATIESEQTQNKDQSENEQQTKRQKASTAKSQHRIVEPSIFYSNTVDFDYDFWEFANRCVANPFLIRFEHSEVLYNNLLNNNNTSPIQNVQCRFSQFKQTIKTGYWQGNIELFFDINNTMKGACGAGTFFYDDLEKLFQPWKPKYKGLQSFTHGDTFNSATAIGEEDTEYIPGEDKRETKQEVPANSAVWVCSMIGGWEGCSRDDSGSSWRWYGSSGHMGIFPVNDPNKDYFSELCTGDMDANSVNPGASARDNTGWNLKAGLTWEKDYDLPEGDYNVIWHCSGIQRFPNIRANGFTLVLGDKNSNLIMWLGSKTEGRYVTNYKFEQIQAEREKEFAVKESQEPTRDDDNTQFNSNIGETDPEALPELEEEREFEGKEFDDKETELKEKSGETEKDFEKELEKEKEKEREAEREKELEKEQETEREKERERERELEKDREKERQQETEKTKESREKQAEKEKKEKDRKEREAKLREKQQQKERDKKEKDKKDKEKKERE